MGSWLDCPCGAKIHTNLFAGARVFRLIRDTDYDAVDDPVDRSKLEDLFFRSGIPVYRCGRCARLATQWDPQKEVVFYTPAAQAGDQPPVGRSGEGEMAAGQGSGTPDKPLPMQGIPIIRRNPDPVRGFLLPAFIHNVEYHLTGLEVYSDGVIDCWGGVDLEIFRRKLAEGWVVTQPPVGSTISFHDLGKATIEAVDWRITPENLAWNVEATVRQLNPLMENLANLKGEETEVRDGIRFSKLAEKGRFSGYRVNLHGIMVPRQGLPLFDNRNGGCSLTWWWLGGDGLSQLGDGMPHRPEMVARMLEDGRLSTSVPNGTRVTIGELGSFVVGHGQWHIKPVERIREGFDRLEMLAGKPGSIRTCKEAFRVYRRNPSPTGVETLRQAYESVPEHQRQYCGNMDSKDWAIRQALYGETPPGPMTDE